MIRNIIDLCDFLLSPDGCLKSVASFLRGNNICNIHWTFFNFLVTEVAALGFSESIYSETFRPVSPEKKNFAEPFFSKVIGWPLLSLNKVSATRYRVLFPHRFLLAFSVQNQQTKICRNLRRKTVAFCAECHKNGQQRCSWISFPAVNINFLHCLR